jgi:hypothetical protein
MRSASGLISLSEKQYQVSTGLARNCRFFLIGRPSPRPRVSPPSRAPKPLFPVKTSALESGSQQLDLVWTSAVEPEVVRYSVELSVLDGSESREAWSEFVDVSSMHLPLPAGAENLAWRVSVVARGWQAMPCLDGRCSPSLRLERSLTPRARSASFSHGQLRFRWIRSGEECGRCSASWLPRRNSARSGSREDRFDGLGSA